MAQGWFGPGAARNESAMAATAAGGRASRRLQKLDNEVRNWSASAAEAVRPPGPVSTNFQPAGAPPRLRGGGRSGGRQPRPFPPPVSRLRTSPKKLDGGPFGRRIWRPGPVDRRFWLSQSLRAPLARRLWPPSRIPAPLRWPLRLFVGRLRPAFEIPGLSVRRPRPVRGPCPSFAGRYWPRCFLSRRGRVPVSL